MPGPMVDVTAARFKNVPLAPEGFAFMYLELYLPDGVTRLDYSDSMQVLEVSSHRLTEDTALLVKVYSPMQMYSTAYEMIVVVD